MKCVDEFPPLNNDHPTNANPSRPVSGDGKPVNSQGTKYSGLLKTAASSSSFSSNNQMNSGMALLYPAPCIIMAIPPLNGSCYVIDTT